eukprot:gene9431-12707_t
MQVPSSSTILTVKLFLQNLHEQLQLDSSSFKHTLIFEINEEYHWVYDYTNENSKKFVEIIPSDNRHTIRSDISLQEFDCMVTTDFETMKLLCTGKKKAMAMFLKGKIQILGDRKVFVSMMSAIKLAVNIMKENEKNKKLIISEVVRTEDNTVPGEQTTTPDNNKVDKLISMELRINITETIEMDILTLTVKNNTNNYNSFDENSSTHQDNMSMKSTPNSKNNDNKNNVNNNNQSNNNRKGMITCYIIEIEDKINNNSWKVYHRYSDFTKLYDKLKQKGYRIPSIETKSTSFLMSSESMIKSRIKTLHSFINNLYIIFKTKNKLFNKFINLNNLNNNSNNFTQSDTYSEDIMNRDSFSTTRESSIFNHNDRLSMIHEEKIGNHNNDYDQNDDNNNDTSNDNEDDMMFSKQILFENAMKPISYDHNNINQSSAFMNELTSLRVMVDELQSKLIINQIFPTILYYLSSFIMFSFTFCIGLLFVVSFSNRHNNNNNNPDIQTTIQLIGLITPIVADNVGYLRSIFVKFAQYLGGRGDIMSAHWSSVLSKLHDKCPHSDENYVKSIIQNELKNSIDDIFDSFDYIPLASASIGQVHVANIKLPSFYNKYNNTIINNNSNNNSEIDTNNINKTEQANRYSNTTNHIFSNIKNNIKSTVYGNGDGNGSNMLSVVVKVQHENIEAIMKSDMNIVIFFTKIAIKIDKRWQLLLDLLTVWNKTMNDELDFFVEANNLNEIHSVMSKSSTGAIVPIPIMQFVTKKVLVMVQLFGYKVTDKLALTLHNIDRSALVTRIAHCCAWQLLVAGVFNADPHPGNLLFCLKRSNKISIDNEDIVPGLLDFGMTVRIPDDRRKSYCRLVLALFEGDIEAASQALKEVGYVNNQTNRVPERDAEFFEYLFRDANSKQSAQQEAKEFQNKRNQQKEEDVQKGVREKKGRSMEKIPEDFIFLTRVIGLLRGLTAELDCSCPIMYILALNASVGLDEILMKDNTDNVDNAR